MVLLCKPDQFEGFLCMLQQLELVKFYESSRYRYVTTRYLHVIMIQNHFYFVKFIIKVLFALKKGTYSKIIEEYRSPFVPLASKSPNENKSSLNVVNSKKVFIEKA